MYGKIRTIIEHRISAAPYNLYVQLSTDGYLVDLDADLGGGDDLGHEEVVAEGALLLDALLVGDVAAVAAGAAVGVVLAAVSLGVGAATAALRGGATSLLAAALAGARRVTGVDGATGGLGGDVGDEEGEDGDGQGLHDERRKGDSRRQ